MDYESPGRSVVIADVDPLVIAALGTLVMVLGLVVLRLHAFLALILGAILIALLTPTPNREWFHLQAAASRISRVEPTTGVLTLAPKSPRPTEGPVHWLGNRSVPAEIQASGTLTQGTVQGREQWSYSGPLPDKASTGAPLWLVSAHALNDARKQARAHPVAIVAEGFGATCRNIGLLILLASVIGRCLTDSLAADRIVGWVQARLGERRAPEGFAASGFLLGMPSFFDTVFYLLMPLGRGLAAHTHRDFLLYTLTIVAGATMAHSLVPPTPGPTFTANEFGIPIGTMMVGGILVGMITVPCGVLYARWANRRWPLPLRPLADGSGSAAPEPGTTKNPLPPLWMAVLPILLPIGLIGAAESWKTFGPGADGSLPATALAFLGQSQMALLVGTGVALCLLARRHGWNLEALRNPVSSAITGGSSVLMITAAGGAFGFVIRQTDIATRIAAFSGDGSFTLLLAAFGITTLVRLAQGSATVAMITAAGVVAPIAAAGQLTYHPVYLALAIGCGSKPVPWMNDSGFWIIGRMSGMTEIETLRSASVMMSLMGIIGFLAVLAGAWLLPFRQ